MSRREYYDNGKRFDRKSRKPKVTQRHPKDGIEAKFVEVTEDQCWGDTSKMIRRFMKKVRKEEILKPYYGKLAYFQSKSQLRRQKKAKGTWLFKKRQEKLEELEKDEF